MPYWIFLSCGVLLGSSAMYLLLRQGKDLGISAPMQNFVLFCFLTIFSCVWVAVEGASFLIPWQQFCGIVATSVFFSWAGNKWSLEALRRAPNPGYSLSITKTYAVTTYLLSPIFFASKITWYGLGAVLAVVFFSGLVAWGEKIKAPAPGKTSWLLLSFLAFLAFGLDSLASIYFRMQGTPASILLFYGCLAITIAMAFELKKNGNFKNLNNLGYANLFLTSVASLIFNWCLLTGYSFAPNPGYMNTVNSSSVALTAILSWIIFKDELNCRKLAGVLGAAASMAILFFA